jgi:hypothetical protein
MSNKYIKISFASFIIVATLVVNVPLFAKSSILRDSIINKTSLKLKDNRPNRPVFKALAPSSFNTLTVKMNASKQTLNAKTAAKPNANTSLESQKPIDNFKIYPNPVSDQLNLSFTLKKESFVTIKILDVLGNDVMTLFNQKLGSGEQNNTFYIDSKLKTGFYFVRIIADSNAIIKRISVL